MIITLHCEPYIRHWLERRFGCPVKIPPKTKISEQLQSCLTKRFHPSRDFGKKTKVEKTEIHITGDSIELGHTIPPTLTNFVNSVLRFQIECEIFQFVNGAKRKGYSQRKAFLLYQSHNGFTEDNFSIDAISQKYFRFCREINNNFSTSVTNKSKAK